MSSTKKYLQVFKQSYATEFPFIKQSRKGEHFAFCTTCSCDVSIAHGRKGDIVSHLKTKKHQDNVKSQEKNQKLDHRFFKTNDNSVIHAECLFTSFLIEHNLPISCADHAGPLFRQMFKDSEVAKKYGCARTKTTAIVGVFANEKVDELISILKQQPLSVATDGSNDSDSKLYPVAVTYFDSERKQIETCLLSLSALEGDSTGRNIGNLLIRNIKSRDIPISNCVALGADNAPVMIGQHTGVAAVLKEEQPNLFVIGCPCHLINLAAEKSAACLPIKVDEILVDIFYYLEKSAKRKEKLKTFQVLHDTDVRKILKHVCTRWLSLGKCLQRMLDQWQPLVSFFNDEIKNKRKNTTSGLQTYQIPKRVCEPKQKGTLPAKNDGFRPKPKTNKEKVVLNSGTKRKLESYVKAEASNKIKAREENVSGKLKPVPARPLPTTSTSKPTTCDGLSREERLFLFLTTKKNKAYCLFLQNCIPVFETTNVVLQSQAPHIHVLRSLLLDLFKGILCKFVKPQVVKESSSLLDVDYHSRENQKDDVDLIIGSSTLKVVEDLAPNDKLEFFQAVRKYFIAACNYIIHKFPLKNEVLINAEVAQLSRIVNASFNQVRYFVDKFPVMLPAQGNETQDEAIDVLQSQFCELQMDNLPSNVLEEKRVDVQWAAVAAIRSADGYPKYDRMSKVVLAVLTIPHSNAECERVFSQVRKTRTQFRASMSDSNLEKLIVMKFRQQGKQCFEQKFDEPLLKKAKSATSVSLKN